VTVAGTTSRAGFVVLRQVGENGWELVGDVPRRAGLPARKARRQAVVDATGSEPSPKERYAVVLRSEWRIALDC